MIFNILSLLMKFRASFITAIGVQDAVLTQTTLRVEAALNSNGNVVTFRLREDGTKFSDQERKLLQGESFMPVAASIKLSKYSKDGSGKNNANHIPSTFVDPNVFSNTDEQSALNKVYQGDLSFIVNGSNSIDKMSTSLMRFAPENGVLAAAGTGQPVDLKAMYGGSYEGMGFTPLITPFPLNGADDISISLALGEGDITGIAGPDANLQNKVIVEVLGWKYKGNAINSGSTTGFCTVPI